MTDVEKAHKQAKRCLRLMAQRNAKYGDSWRRLRLSSIIDLMAAKLARAQEQESDHEAIAEELLDVANYALLSLIRIDEKSRE